MAQIVYQVDAFSTEPFKGNPAAVCVLEKFPDEVFMQALAMEMNLSETAFVCQRADGDYDLRWFTPAVEVDLCGHATLASAHVLWETGLVAVDEPIAFHTRSGLLPVKLADGWIEMDFPSESSRPIQVPKGLAEALGCEIANVEANRMDLLVEVNSESMVRALAPDIALLKEVDYPRGVIVTAQAYGDDCDFVSRFFAPKVGVAEDPVTGSAHCCLAPYWGRRLGRQRFSARQLSARGGQLRLVLGDGRVQISGQAVTVLRAELDDCADICENSEQ